MPKKRAETASDAATLSPEAIEKATPKAGIVLVEEMPDKTWKVLAPFTLGKFGNGAVKKRTEPLEKYYTLGKGSVDDVDKGSLWAAAVREFKEETGISIEKIADQEKYKATAKLPGEDKKKRVILDDVFAASADGKLIHISRKGDKIESYDDLVEKLAAKAEKGGGLVGCQHILTPSSQGYVNSQHLFLVKVNHLDLLKTHCKSYDQVMTRPSLESIATQAKAEKLPPIESLIEILRTGRVPESFKDDPQAPITPESYRAGIAKTLFKEPLLPVFEEMYFRKVAADSKKNYVPRHIATQQEFDAMFDSFPADSRFNQLKAQMATIKTYLRKEMGLFKDADKGLKLDLKYGLHYVIEGADVMPFAPPALPQKYQSDAPTYLTEINSLADRSALYKMTMFGRQARDPITYQAGITLPSAVDGLAGMVGVDLPHFSGMQLGLSFEPDRLIVQGAPIGNLAMNERLLEALNKRSEAVAALQGKSANGRG